LATDGPLGKALTYNRLNVLLSSVVLIAAYAGSLIWVEGISLMSVYLILALAFDFVP
jgi:hypothetical protein